MQQVLEPQHAQNHEMSELFDGIVAPLTSAIIVLIDQPTTLPRLFDLLLSRIPSFFDITLSKQAESSVSMPCCCLMMGMCFSHSQLKAAVSQRLHDLEQTEQLAMMEKLRLSQDVLSNFIASEVENRIDAHTVLTNQHLLTLNTDCDEGLFFELWPASTQDKSNITPHIAKKRLINNQAHLENEARVFESMKKIFDENQNLE